MKNPCFYREPKRLLDFLTELRWGVAYRAVGTPPQRAILESLIQQGWGISYRPMQLRHPGGREQLGTWRRGPSSLYEGVGCQQAQLGWSLLQGAQMNVPRCQLLSSEDSLSQHHQILIFQGKDTSGQHLHSRRILYKPVCVLLSFTTLPTMFLLRMSHQWPQNSTALPRSQKASPQS